MVSVPNEIMSAYVKLLDIRDIPQGQAEYYKKWLRYYYDFSTKYLQMQDQAVKVRLFLEKLKSKGQSPAKCQQAAHAVALYFDLHEQIAKLSIEGNAVVESSADTTLEQIPAPPAAAERPGISGQPQHFRPTQYSTTGYQEKSDSTEWDALIGKLADEIKVRHYSRKTLKTYASGPASSNGF